ncbi:AbiTii domain-containing protein [Micromonospora aurantiaca (nom. illeg.)]|uniref:AbiTii domain-containing protein n=1 Tax=Micromonospora aurantiaca (nom. illeg.) TaxID=47850 RepID=UPI0035B4DB00
MSHKRESLLGQIEAGVLDEGTPLASLLQKCIILGGQAGSEKLRDWARQELNGYQGETVPPYRRIYTGLVAILTNSAGYNAMNQRISAAVFPRQFRDFLDEQGIDLETAVLGGGIGELEALANRGESEHRLMPPWADAVIEMLNKFNVGPNTRVQVVYWPLSDAALRGLLVRVRTALAEMIAELIALTPAAQTIPDKAAADQAVQLVITGHRPTIHVTSQQAHSGGTNVAVGPSRDSPVTVSGAGTAIGTQTASGSGSSAVGSQSASGSHTSLTGRDVAVADPSAEQSWWARLRKRGWVVTVTTILGGIAGVAGAVLALFTWLGWTPWWR